MANSSNTNYGVWVNNAGEHRIYEWGIGERAATKHEKDMHYQSQGVQGEARVKREAQLIRDRAALRQHSEHEAER